MKIIILIVLALQAFICAAQTNGLNMTWQCPPDRVPLLYEFCHGPARGVFSVHPHPTDQTNMFVPIKALWPGENWFAVTAVDTATNSAEFRESDYGNWVVIKVTPAVMLGNESAIIGGSTNDLYESSTNLKDWTPIDASKPIPMIQSQQFFRAINATKVTMQQTPIFDINNTP